MSKQKTPGKNGGAVTKLGELLFLFSFYLVDYGFKSVVK